MPMDSQAERQIAASLAYRVGPRATASQIADATELDALTGLPNRVLLLDRLAGGIAAAKRHGTRLAVLFVDLDKFKEINDTLGHPVGDEALIFVARCLAQSVRAADTVSRLGGDEFVVLLAEVAHGSGAMLVADKMIALLSAPSRIGGHALRLSASIGISLYPDDGQDASTLIERADAAMYRAKRRGAGSCVFHGDRLNESLEAPMALGATHPARPAHAPPALPHMASRHAELQEANEQLVLAALSAQELQDAMQEAQRRQTEFLTLVANELSDPLAPIRLAAAQLGRVPSDEASLPRAQAIIERQAAHMARLVNDLLEMSRGNPGRLRFKREQIDLIGIVEAAIKSIGPAMSARCQTLVSQMPAPPLQLHGNAAHLSQVVGNLLDNASKYTPEGGEIGLAAAMVGDRIVITVSDNGLGMTEEALLKVFEPFVQDTLVIGVKGLGVGIGLTVVRELVEAHGGSVAASSRGRGMGSQFIVTLPVSPA
jgi:diguanylate cyclase